MDATTQQLEAQLIRLEQSLDEQNRLERRASRAVFLLSAVLTLVMLAFLGVNYAHLRSEWTEEKFSKSLDQELQELHPAAMLELKALGEHLLPVYADESRRQLTKLGPHISQALVTSLDRLAKDLRTQGHERLLASHKRVSNKIYDTIFTCFPGLRSESEQRQLEESFRRTTKEAVSDAIGGFQEKYTKEINEVQDHLESYAVADSNLSNFELQKRFLSLWLQLLDTEIQKL